MPRRINQGRELSPRTHGDAQLFGQSRTLRIKQLLGLACSMDNLDLAAPSVILHKRRFSCPFAGLRASCNQLRKSSSAASQILSSTMFSSVSPLYPKLYPCWLADQHSVKRRRFASLRRVRTAQTPGAHDEAGDSCTRSDMHLSAEAKVQARPTRPGGSDRSDLGFTSR